MKGLDGFAQPDEQEGFVYAAGNANPQCKRLDRDAAQYLRSEFEASFSFRAKLGGKRER